MNNNFDFFVSKVIFIPAPAENQEAHGKLTMISGQVFTFKGKGTRKELNNEMHYLGMKHLNSSEFKSENFTFKRTKFSYSAFIIIF